ncbi:hypothetical protein MKZ38_003704 [Zalerion maritima]|uniref:Uncharacterized protein n=1 Tax=Zalerion maritima TaxID=339359 RepID=A0AAD5WX10_9PEZI|nr:hypothetical protein MKZ38_003704 [Zalerion maritima]
MSGSEKKAAVQRQLMLRKARKVVLDQQARVLQKKSLKLKSEHGNTYRKAEETETHLSNNLDGPAGALFDDIGAHKKAVDEHQSLSKQLNKSRKLCLLQHKDILQQTEQFVSLAGKRDKVLRKIEVKEKELALLQNSQPDESSDESDSELTATNFSGSDESDDEDDDAHQIPASREPAQVLAEVQFPEGSSHQAHSSPPNSDRDSDRDSDDEGLFVSNDSSSYVDDGETSDETDGEPVKDEQSALLESVQDGELYGDGGDQELIDVDNLGSEIGYKQAGTESSSQARSLLTSGTGKRKRTSESHERDIAPVSGRSSIMTPPPTQEEIELVSRLRDKDIFTISNGIFVSPEYVKGVPVVKIRESSQDNYWNPNWTTWAFISEGIRDATEKIKDLDVRQHNTTDSKVEQRLIEERHKHADRRSNLESVSKMGLRFIPDWHPNQLLSKELVSDPNTNSGKGLLYQQSMMALGSLLKDLKKAATTGKIKMTPVNFIRWRLGEMLKMDPGRGVGNAIQKMKSVRAGDPVTKYVCDLARRRVSAGTDSRRSFGVLTGARSGARRVGFGSVTNHSINEIARENREAAAQDRGTAGSRPPVSTVDINRGTAQPDSIRRDLGNNSHAGVAQRHSVLDRMLPRPPQRIVSTRNNRNRNQPSPNRRSTGRPGLARFTQASRQQSANRGRRGNTPAAVDRVQNASRTNHRDYGYERRMASRRGHRQEAEEDPEDFLMFRGRKPGTNRP